MRWSFEVLLLVFLVVLGIGWFNSSGEARLLGERADSIARVRDSVTVLNTQLRERNQIDSLALIVASEQATLDSAVIAAIRRAAHESAQEATQAVAAAAGDLRTLLVTLGAPTAALDSLEARMARQDVAHAEELFAADSMTSVERNLRLSTERALAAERALRLGVEDELVRADAQITALRDQVSALNSRARRQRLLGGGIGLVLLGVALLR